MTADAAPTDVFDRFLRYEELVAWLHDAAAAHPHLMQLDTYGTSFEGRSLWLATITDSATGTHDTKPAHWVDANIHSVELTASAAALYLIHHLLTGHGDDATITRALRTRTFYVVPRVNPDGAEWALADRPRYRRSSVRPWPWVPIRTTSTVTGGSSPCASPTGMAHGWRQPPTDG
jgi:murein tripeptide amidase MpaA